MAIGTGAALLGAGILGAGASIAGSKRAAGAVGDASAASVAEQRRQFDIATGLARPAINSGNTARNQLMQLLGLSGDSGFNPNAIDTSGFRQANPNARGIGRFSRGGPTGGFGSLARDPRGGEFGGPGRLLGATPQAGAPVGQQDPIDIIKNTPGYQFQLEQGTRALNANRSAGGNSGGALMKDFARFNQGVASSFYSDYANRLAGLAGSAQTASATLGNQSIQSGQIIGNNLQNAGNARASGIVGSTNAFTGLLGDLAGAYGSGIFNRGPFAANLGTPNEF